MIYLKSFSIDTEKTRPFPFNIAAVRHAKKLVFETPVTILVGDNGCGKSTILECIGQQLNLPLIGGMIGSNESFQAATLLRPFVHLQFQNK